MKQILTQDQASAVGTAIAALDAAGGRATRLAFPVEGGTIKIRQPHYGGIVVLLIDERGTVVTQNRYGTLADFAASHRQAA